MMRNAVGWVSLFTAVLCLMFLGFGSTNPLVLSAAGVCAVVCITVFTFPRTPQPVSRHFARPTELKETK